MSKHLFSSLLVAFVGAAVACSSSDSANSADGGTAGSGACGGHSDCVSCAEDVTNHCSFCNGKCIAEPGSGSLGKADGATCDSGYVSLGSDCSLGGGILGKPTTLAVDCRHPKNAANPKCDDGSRTPGQVGAGPQFSTAAGLNGAVFDVANHRLLIASSVGAGPLARGQIFAVDIDTGDRKIVSGAYIDPRTGETTVGSGPLLGKSVDDVAFLPDGDLVAFANGDAGSGFYRVKLATGDRSVIAAYQGADSPCVFGGKAWNFGPQIAAGADGRLYALSGQPTTGPVLDELGGVVTVGLDGKCSFVTKWDKSETERVGKGPAISIFEDLVAVGSKLYALDLNGTIQAIDPTTGDRTLITSSQTTSLIGKGGAIDNKHIERGPDDNTLFTSGGMPHNADPDKQGDGPWPIVEVNVVSGDRTLRHAYHGPIGRMPQKAGFVVPHPKMPGIMIIVFEVLVALYEPATGNSMLLSF